MVAFRHIYQSRVVAFSQFRQSHAKCVSRLVTVLYLVQTNKMCAVFTGFTEEKAKVVAAVWGDKIVSILCHASYFAPG